MKDKKTFVLRIDQAMYDALEKWAQDEFRSVNGQIEWMIAKQLRDSNRVKNANDKIDNNHSKSKKPEN